MHENLKETWRFYVMFIVGLCLIWAGTQVEPPLKTALSALGAIGFFGAGFLAINWNRKKKKAEKEAQKDNEQK